MTFYSGYKLIEISMETEPALEVAVCYPTASEPVPFTEGPFDHLAARDAVIADGVFPLVMISHGSGGSRQTHRGLCQYLAARGYIVAVYDEPGNCRSDNSMSEDPCLLLHRSTRLKACIDMLYKGEFGQSLGPVTVIGHSIGAATGLCLAGGKPTTLPHQSPDRTAVTLSTPVDSRVGALVLLAPATVWFRLPGALAGVDCRIYMVASYADEMIPYFYLPELVLSGVPERSLVTYDLVENAGHYSFLSPFPEALSNSPAARDADGFDREAFLNWLYERIYAFLEAPDTVPSNSEH